MKDIRRKLDIARVGAVAALALLMAFASVFVLSGISAGSTAYAAPQISKAKKTVAVNESFSLKVKGAGGKIVAWKSSNKRIAVVSAKGKVTGKKPGTATITAKVGGKKLKCKVTVATHKSIAKKSLDGWWHQFRHVGDYIYVKNGVAYRFPGHYENGELVYETTGVTKQKVSKLTRTKLDPENSKKRDGYRIRITGGGVKMDFYYYDNERSILWNRLGKNFEQCSGSSSWERVATSSVPKTLRQYAKRLK